MAALMAPETDPWAFDYSLIPDETIATFRRYFEHGIPPGSFCVAVLCNDLSGAVLRADQFNARAIGAIVCWLYNNAPAGSWGSEENYFSWIRRVYGHKLINGLLNVVGAA